ncbi:uncharacterized protein LOC143838706 [Paroedura picta]|uniref:uncharacterized protein LOC143838706 n=1 Tax=Paroedura picta TaxID=143630 RepID=UPI00405762CB
MRPNRVKPVPSQATNKMDQGASGLQGSVGLDPSSPRSSTLLNSFSPSGSLFPDLSTPRNPLLPELSSLPRPASPRGSLISGSSKSILSQESFSPSPSVSLNLRVSGGSLFHGSPFQQLPAKPKGLTLKHDSARKPTVDDELPNWLCATLALLLICLLLLALMCLMTAKVKKLAEVSREQRKAMRLKVLILSESLTQLQMGKAWTCPMCRVNWVQQGDLCFMFSDLKFSWQTSKNFCMDQVSTLAVVETKEEMDFLKHESGRYFIIYRGKHRYYNFWIGLEYANLTSLTLRDGTRVPVALALHAGPNPCVYLRHGKLYAMSCHKMYNFICKTKVEFGLN